MSRQTRRSARPQIETLEGRSLMAAGITASFRDGILTINGTDKADQIYVAQDNGSIQVKAMKVTSGPSSVETKPGGIVIESYSTTYEKKAIDISKGSSAVKSLKATTVDKIVVNGYGSDDVIRLDDGAQKITAKGVLSGGAGDDYLVGGEGGDEIYGGGDDYLSGGAGADLLSGNAGRDELYGGEDRDTLFGTFGEDETLSGNAGDDQFNLTFNLDTFFKYQGHDSIADPGATSGTDTYDVWMDLGARGKEIINTFVGQTKQFTDQLQPVVNLLNQKLTVADGLSTPTLGSLLGGNYKSVAATISDLAQYNANAVGAGQFYLGQFTNSSSGGVRLKSNGSLASQGFVKELKRLDGGAFDVSGLTDATKLLRLAMGQNVDLLKFDMGKLAVSGGTLNKYLGTVMIGPVPVQFWLRGSLNFTAGGSIAYDTTGLREGNLLRGVKLGGAYATISAPVRIEAVAGTDGFGVGGGGEVTGSYSVSVGNVRLGSGGSVASKLSTGGGLYYRMYVFAEYPQSQWVESISYVKSWKDLWNWVWKPVSNWNEVYSTKRDERNIFDGYLPM